MRDPRIFAPPCIHGCQKKVIYSADVNGMSSKAAQVLTCIDDINIERTRDVQIAILKGKTTVDSNGGATSEY